MQTLQELIHHFAHNKYIYLKLIQQDSFWGWLFIYQFGLKKKIKYLKESHPRELVVALYRVSEIVLQGPEFSVQVVVNRNGATKQKPSELD